MHPGWEGPLVVAIAAAEKADDARGFTVIAAPKPDKFKFLGDRFGEPKGGLNGLCAAREQLNVGNVFRQQPDDQIKKTSACLGRETAERYAVEFVFRVV